MRTARFSGGLFGAPQNSVMFGAPAGGVAFGGAPLPLPQAMCANQAHLSAPPPPPPIRKEFPETWLWQSITDEYVVYLRIFLKANHSKYT